MRRFFAALSVLAACTLPAVAADEDTSLTKLMTAYEAAGWEGVGRLNIGRSGMCTGALVSTTHVLTAAHCLYNSHTGEQVDPRGIEFLAGWRNGRASATRMVRRAAIHPAYEYTGPEGDLRVAHDLALLELESPIRLSNVQPFEIAERPRKGSAVGVVSYAHDRAETPSIQEVCHVLARQRGSLILSCDVDFGASGAPIFAQVNGEPRIVSVVSAMAEIRGRSVSLGTSLERPLAELRAMLKLPATAPEAQIIARDEVPTVNRVANSGGALNSGGTALNSGSAKFLRP